MKIIFLIFNLIFILNILLFFNSVSAESFGVFPKDSNINLIFQCQNSTYLNISKLYTNKVIYLNSETLTTKTGSVYNYSFTNSSEINTYYVNYHCNPNGIDIVSAASFVVTLTGNEVDLPQVLVMFFIIGVITLIGILFFIFGLRSEMPGIKLFCLAMSVILIVFLVGYIMNIANISIGEFTDLTNGFTPLYVLFITLLTVGGIGIIIYIIAFSLDAFYRKRGLKL